MHKTNIYTVFIRCLEILQGNVKSIDGLLIVLYMLIKLP